jgi:hypothetical protein
MLEARRVLIAHLPNQAVNSKPTTTGMLTRNRLGHGIVAPKSVYSRHPTATKPMTAAPKKSITMPSAV